jgi:hypothetical protein
MSTNVLTDKEAGSYHTKLLGMRIIVLRPTCITSHTGWRDGGRGWTWFASGVITQGVTILAITTHEVTTGGETTGAWVALRFWCFANVGGALLLPGTSAPVLALTPGVATIWGTGPFKLSKLLYKDVTFTWVTFI